MNILFLNAYFAPEVISFSHLEHELIDALVARGHEIFVLCPVPSRGVSREEAAKHPAGEEELLWDGHVHVRRFSAPREGSGVLGRALRYLWCNLRQYMLGKRYRGAVDAVFAVSTPPTQGYLAGKLKKKLGCPLIYSLQDIFPDSLVTTGISREKSLAWRVGARIERKTYAMADRIVVISESFRENLRRKQVPEEKMVLISNWVDTDAVRPVPRAENPLAKELGIPEDRFVVVYAGNFGAAQGTEVITAAAELLREEEKITFALFGRGALFEQMRETAEKEGGSNVIWHDLLPQERVSEVYSLGDAALITAKKGVGGSGMPSKTWSIMACNTPIVASFDVPSELADVIARAEGGVCVPPGDAEKLARAIAAQYRGGKRTCRSREYVLKNASKTVCAAAYCELIEGVCAEKEKETAP